MREYTVKNLTETKKIATQLAKELVGGELLALTGNLGAGKTAFIQALAKTLGVKENITSPTFVLMKVYDIKYRKAKKFVHVDCYRLSGHEDLFDIGLGDYLNYDTVIVAIEWADKIANLPDRTIRINMELVENNKRKITVS
ncbi:MAG: tRNA (adenosine(37)-N6)-threonylcarbamoyltransferase complex ATPase subunit type 1 TsaE [Candidatus Komeilibacteria bacterium RIFOXYC1_FULL_37_11]|uniref:tRNA threonylcarbamoyladenosine biosynthesis protein TsaE n=1 Tax=Candidatus Komeilibacteria bacterium RIFOXYC1_FULL_37_11 TaxID=1798555 RepID=A0A1G2BXP4_9BACT|nr:MAG: tRNA (adenosine(37)-N6)-threonylcarbamoyltransferase complex ATPase subunit type 1 TsaE [Candidatus Komeilibacteria bacterium RIFOXYC1_FULL_37_11]OGY95174.1 MAG: tRNA (adenosine(37)-N6)-threonylcarbamoyltransferase complex ATPase subunit type 1 TsaE [Candidatus Komeilibacteria bacterium RIFOXYD1_FULL_37_29]